jgi:alpha,alpha-trehalase
MNPGIGRINSFLKSRGIEIPYGSPQDDPDKETVCGLGNRKNRLFHKLLKQEGVEIYKSTIELVRTLKRKGFKTAVVSSSKNCSAVLEAADIEELFEIQVDGVVAENLHLQGKPAPDIFLEAARRLAAKPERAIVVEDAVSGVQAAKRGRFGLVVGVDRHNRSEGLEEERADIVVSDLSEVAVIDPPPSMTPSEAVPSALESMGKIAHYSKGKRLYVFLDYDGTLTPIVEDPQAALLSNQMRDTLRDLSEICTVAVISGRDRRDVENLVGLETIIYAGSHGFDIASPRGEHLEYEKGAEFLPALNQAETALKKRLKEVQGSVVERKKYSIAVHYRQVNDRDIGQVERIVDQVRAQSPGLRKSSGKKIFELQPDIDWDKGRAVLWLLEILEADPSRAAPLYVGDDTTDEDAFRALSPHGVTIIVTETSQDTAAGYRLRNPGEVQTFLAELASLAKGGNR